MAINPLKNKKVLITCGPTWVALDEMRVVSNRSSGQLGHLLTRHFKNEGAHVTLLEGPVEKPLTLKSVRVQRFKFYDELLSLLKKELKKKPDIIVHAAAVSDYRPQRPFKGKISSSLRLLKITLVPTAKIINRIKHLYPHAYLVGFKLESGLNKISAKQKAKKLFNETGCNLALVNSVKNDYQGFIINPDLKILAEAKSRASMSRALVQTLKRTL